MQLQMSLLPTDPRKCKACPLHETAEFVCLLGQGSKSKRAMVVGEAPGHREDDSGVPFVGKSGKLLDRLLTEVGLDRKDLYVTNAVHCRPPDNRTPSKKEIAACKPWLDKEIADVKPKYVLILGNTPLQSCLQLKGIRKYRGRLIEKDRIFYLPTYHPSFALRDPRQESVLKGDLLSFKSLIDSGGLPREEKLNFRVVNDLKTFDKMIDDILDSIVVSYDGESNMLSPFQPNSKMSCISVGTAGTQWVLPLNHPEGTWNDNYPMQKRLLQRIVDAAKGAKMVAHNGKFDSLWLLVVYGIRWDCDFDTMLAHYLLDENSRHGLKELATIYCSAPNYDIDKDSKVGNTTIEKLARYNAHDTYYTRKLYYIFLRELKRDKPLYNVFFKLLMPISRLFVEIEKQGVYVDMERLHEVGIVLNKRLKEAKQKMDKYAPKVFDKKGRPVEFNWGSPKQVAGFLFGKLKLKPLDMTAKGQPSTSESVLKRLASLHEVPRELMKYRECKQQLSFFIEGWQPGIVNSRLHPSFKLHGTVTGRLSCENPNLQQVPRDPLIRSLLCAPPGWEFVEADLSQIELRVIAELARETNMLHAFQTNIDLHWKTLLSSLTSGQGSYADEAIRTAGLYCVQQGLQADGASCKILLEVWEANKKKETSSKLIEASNKNWAEGRSREWWQSSRGKERVMERWNTYVAKEASKEEVLRSLQRYEQHLSSSQKPKKQRLDPIEFSDAMQILSCIGPSHATKLAPLWKEARKKAKATAFGYAYGMGWKKFKDYARDNYDLVVTDKEAQESRELFFRLYPALLLYHNRQRKFVKAYGYVRSLSGRLRRLPAAYGNAETMEAHEAQRQAINSPVQSFANDLNLMAALEMGKEFPKSEVKLMGTVHDAILMLVKEEKLSYYVPKIKQIMSHPSLMDELGINLSVPILAEVTIGAWGVGKSEEDYFKEKGIVIK